MKMRKDVNRANLGVVGIILAAALLYFPPYAWAWVGDDYVQFDYVLEFLKRPLSAFQLFNPYFLPWYYRPLQNIWFLGNRLLFGLTPAAFYWQMVLWHSLAIALVYRVLRQFGVSPLAAVLASALFAIHGHYVDVVGWNSSVAIVMAAVFSLASLSSYLTAESAEGTEKNKRLGVSFLLFVLALLTHEEAILLPLFLIALAFVESRKQKAKGRKIKVSTGQVITLVGMLGLTAVLIFIQFNRPNLTIDLSETPSKQWLALASPIQISQFIKDISLRYTLTSNWDVTLNTTPIFLAIAILLLLGAWFLYGSWTVRLGLIWVLLHGGLIFATLYQAKPNLLAGRHFYQAAFGIALALGGSLDQLLALDSPPVKVGKWRVSLMTSVLVGVVTGTLLYHTASTRTTQQAWLARAQEDQSAKTQMQAILPEIGPDTRVFANRFPITPQFMRSVTEIWYELGQSVPMPSGSFTQLQLHGKATPDYYVFDYENGKVMNLMPELQQADETVFIWSQEPRLDIVAGDGETLETATNAGEQGFAVVGTEENRRFAVKLAPSALIDGWLSLVYEIPTVPVNSYLRLSMRTDVVPGTPVRVRLDLASGESVTIFEGTTTGEWLELTKPMAEYAGQTVRVRLETAVAPGGTVYWGNPRFVVD